MSFDYNVLKLELEEEYGLPSVELLEYFISIPYSIRLLVNINSSPYWYFNGAAFALPNDYHNWLEVEVENGITLYYCREELLDPSNWRIERNGFMSINESRHFAIPCDLKYYTEDIFRLVNEMSLSVDHFTIDQSGPVGLADISFDKGNFKMSFEFSDIMLCMLKIWEWVYTINIDLNQPSIKELGGKIELINHVDWGGSVVLVDSYALGCFLQDYSRYICYGDLTPFSEIAGWQSYKNTSFLIKKSPDRTDEREKYFKIGKISFLEGDFNLIYLLPNNDNHC